MLTDIFIFNFYIFYSETKLGTSLLGFFFPLPEPLGGWAWAYTLIILFISGSACSNTAMDAQLDPSQLYSYCLLQFVSS